MHVARALWQGLSVRKESRVHAVATRAWYATSQALGMRRGVLLTAVTMRTLGWIPKMDDGIQRREQTHEHFQHLGLDQVVDWMQGDIVKPVCLTKGPTLP